MGEFAALGTAAIPLNRGWLCVCCTAIVVLELKGLAEGLLGEHAFCHLWSGRQRLHQVQRHREEAARAFVTAGRRRAGESCRFV